MYRQADWLADTYGWSLQHIFEYVTIYDVQQLQKYGIPRRERQEAAQYRAIAGIIKVASFHEKGSAGEFKKLMAQLEVHDETYTDRPFDKAGLNMLAKTVQANRQRGGF